MKRRISLLLAVVMVLGSFASVFAAEISAEDYVELAIETVTDAGILVGNSEGDLDLGSALKRKDSVVLMSRLLGQEDAAKEFGETEEVKKFKDLPNNKYYKSVISWGIAEAGFKGSTATTFRPDHSLTAAEYSKLLLEALGYKQDVDFKWSEVLEKARELGLLKHVDVKEAADEVLRRDIAVMTFNALNTKLKGKNVTLAQELGIIIPEIPGIIGEVEVKAISEKQIQVRFADAVAKADQKKVEFVITDDNNKDVKLNAPKWNAKGDTVVLERNFGLTFKEGNYQVEIKGIDLTESKFEVEITKAKAQELKIKENFLSLGKDVEQGLKVFTVDQYGTEKEVAAPVLAAKNLTDGKAIMVNEANNKLVLGVKEGNVNKFSVKEGDIISVTALDKATALNVTKELEVVAGSVVDEIVLGDVVVLDKKGKVVDSLIKGEDGKAYVEINAFDQFESKIKLDKGFDNIKFFATGLNRVAGKDSVEVSDIKNYKELSSDAKKVLNKDSQYIVIEDKQVASNVNEVALYAVIVRASGVENSNLAKFDVVSAGGAVEFKLAKGFEPVVTAGKSATIKLDFFDKLDRPTKAPEDLIVKSLNTDVITASYNKGNVEVKAADIKTLSEEVKVTLELRDGFKTLQTETIELIVVKPVSSYKVSFEGIDKGAKINAGEEVELTIKAYEKEDKVHEAYDKKESVVVEVGNQKYFRTAEFDKGVAKVKAPITKAVKNGNVKVKVNGVDNSAIKAQETIEDLTVNPLAVSKFALNKDNAKQILALDKYNNLNTEYNKVEIAKDAKAENIKLEELDSEGNFKVNFKNGVMELAQAFEGDKAKLTVTIDGKATVLTVAGSVDVDGVVSSPDEEEPTEPTKPTDPKDPAEEGNDITAEHIVEVSDFTISSAKMTVIRVSIPENVSEVKVLEYNGIVQAQGEGKEVALNQKPVILSGKMNEEVNTFKIQYVIDGETRVAEIKKEVK